MSYILAAGCLQEYVTENGTILVLHRYCSDLGAEQRIEKKSFEQYDITDNDVLQLTLIYYTSNRFLIL